MQVKSRIFFDYFDTVSYIYCFSAEESEEDFQNTVLLIKEELEYYHKLLDIYNSYPDFNNLHTINENAGKSVKTEPELIEFLEDARKMYFHTEGEMNIMLGSVLKVWEKNKELGKVADEESLKEAFSHSQIEKLIIDKKNNTVMLSDSCSIIDAGAVGKGYAVQKIIQMLKEKEKNGYVINIGGNIYVLGNKNGQKFTVGIKDPDNAEKNKVTIQIEDSAVVTSGSYERFYEVNNIKYNHIIDKDTLYPANFYSSVTVIDKDSFFADALATALFCTNYEDAVMMAGDLPVLWIFTNGDIKYTENFSQFLTKKNL